MVGSALGIADAQSCRLHCGNNHPEATHFTWFDYRTNYQMAGWKQHKCNCKKDVTTKRRDEVGAVSGVVNCDMKGKWMQRPEALETYSYNTEKNPYMVKLERGGWQIKKVSKNQHNAIA